MRLVMVKSRAATPKGATMRNTASIQVMHTS